jgi:hypothetical protein
MVNKKSKKKEASNKRQKVKDLVVPELGGYLSMDEHLKIQQKIDSIIDNFKFEKVHKAMEALDWKWHLPGKEELSVPSVADLIRTSRYLLSKVATGPERVWSTGGLLAERYEDGGLSLLFYIDHSFDDD